MTTFSQLIDELLVTSGRRNKLTDLTRFTNQTIRECHANQQGKPYMFQINLVEDALIADTDLAFKWRVPMTFQIMQTASYLNALNTDGRPIFPKFQPPGRRINDLQYYYYRSGTAFVFAGFGGIGAQINIAYYAYPNRLPYLEVGQRPAIFNELTQEYEFFDLTSTGGLDYTMPENQQTALDLTTNWVLEKWPEVVRWGVLSSLYPLVGDARASVHFARFNTLREQLITEEGGQVLDPNQG